MLGGLRSVLGGGGGSDTYTECRRCGCTLDHGTGDCPYCGTDSVARYELG